MQTYINGFIYKLTNRRQETKTISETNKNLYEKKKHNFLIKPAPNFTSVSKILRFAKLVGRRRRDRCSFNPEKSLNHPQDLNTGSPTWNTMAQLPSEHIHDMPFLVTPKGHPNGAFAAPAGQPLVLSSERTSQTSSCLQKVLFGSG